MIRFSHSDFLFSDFVPGRRVGTVVPHMVFRNHITYETTNNIWSLQALAEKEELPASMVLKYMQYELTFEQKSRGFLK